MPLLRVSTAAFSGPLPMLVARRERHGPPSGKAWFGLFWVFWVFWVFWQSWSVSVINAFQNLNNKSQPEVVAGLVLKF